jgi:hypothetical protein
VLLLFCGVCGVVCVVCCDFERNSDTYFGWFLSIRFLRIRVKIGAILDFEVVIFTVFVCYKKVRELSPQIQSGHDSFNITKSNQITTLATHEVLKHTK